MKQHSIFEGVVRTEDAYTNLLRNLMIADAKFGKEVFRSLLPPQLHNHAEESFIVETQVALGEHGRADMLIETNSVLLLVEVKISVYCDLTQNQQLEDDLERNGYLKFLRNGKSANNNIAIVFLAPHSWKHAKPVQAALSRLSDPIGNFCAWESVRGLTSGDSFSDWVKEFSKLLERDLMSISFSPDDSKELRNANQSFSSASRKLHELIKRSQKDLNSRSIPGLKSEWAGNASEYGFYLYLYEKVVLWVGIWDVSSFPAVAAIKESWKMAPSLIRILEQKDLKVHKHEGWHLYDLTGVLLKNEQDPLVSLVEFLGQIANDAANSSSSQ